MDSDSLTNTVMNTHLEALENDAFCQFELDVTSECLQAGGQVRTSNSAALLEFIQHIDFDALFDRFDDEQVARRLLARAYWHPSGFVRTQLFTSTRDRPELRLHHWRRNIPGESFDEAIHEHPWDGLSIVLEGRVVNEFWRLEPGADLSVSYFETADVTSARYCALGTCSARLQAESEIGPHEYYWIPSGCFHRTRLVSDSAITLFLRGPFLRLFSLMAASGGPATYSSGRQSPIDRALIDRMVLCLRRAAAGGGLRSVRPTCGAT